MSTNDMDSFNRAIKESKAKKRKSLYNILKKNGLLDRCRFPNDGTVIVDSKYTYYCQKKIVKVKGFNKKYQMRGVQHFIDVFLNNIKGKELKMSNKNKQVIVVTMPELGWDCVVRVADSLEAAARSLGFNSVEDLENDEQYVVTEKNLETL